MSKKKAHDCIPIITPVFHAILRGQREESLSFECTFRGSGKRDKRWQTVRNAKLGPPASVMGGKGARRTTRSSFGHYHGVIKHSAGVFHLHITDFCFSRRTLSDCVFVGRRRTGCGNDSGASKINNVHSPNTHTVLASHTCILCPFLLCNIVDRRNVKHARRDALYDA